MGASLGIEGIIPADDRFKEMLNVWNACVKAKVKIPERVKEFFNHDKPDMKGVSLCLDVDDHECISEYTSEYQKGFEIDLSKLPENIKFIRAYLSY